MKKTSILLADDHGVVRKGLRFVLESEADLEVAGEAGDGRQAVNMTAALRPDVVVMDIAMPQLNGIDATGLIVRERPETAVIILSMHSDEEYVVRALTAGAMNAHNTFAAPDTVRPTRFDGASLKGNRLEINLPAKAVVVLELR